MKLTPIFASAALLLFGTLSLSSPLSADPGGHSGYGDKGNARDENARDENDREARDNNYREDGRMARHDRRSWRDERHDSKWDDGEHNGYYRDKTFYRGRPSARAMRSSKFSYGYKPWARGERLGYYRNRYETVDYRSLNRRHPRRGYHWVRDERGDVLLVAIATGVIVDMIISNN